MKSLRRNEKSDERSEECGQQPHDAAGDDLGQVPATAREDEESVWYGDGKGFLVPVRRDLTLDVDRLLSAEPNVVMVFGAGEKTKVFKLGQHACLIHGATVFRTLEPAEKVALFKAMLPDFEKEDVQVKRAVIHAEAYQGKGPIDIVSIEDGKRGQSR